METPAASTTASAAAAPAGAAAAAGAPGVRRATTTGTIPATPSHQVSFEDGNATARPGAREIRKGRSEPYGREVTKRKGFCYVSAVPYIRDEIMMHAGSQPHLA